MGTIQDPKITEDLVRFAIGEVAARTGTSNPIILLLTPANVRKANDVVLAIQTGAQSKAEIARAAGCRNDDDFDGFLAAMNTLGWFEIEDSGRIRLIPSLRV